MPRKAKPTAQIRIGYFKPFEKNGKEYRYSKIYLSEKGVPYQIRMNCTDMKFFIVNVKEKRIVYRYKGSITVKDLIYKRARKEFMRFIKMNYGFIDQDYGRKDKPYLLMRLKKLMIELGEIRNEG